MGCDHSLRMALGGNLLGIARIAVEGSFLEREIKSMEPV